MVNVIDSRQATAREVSPVARFINNASVRLILFLLVMACVLPITAVAATLILNYYGQERARLSANAISQARGIVSTVDREIAITQAALLALATSRQLAGDDLEGFHQRATEALVNLNATSILLVDESGQILLSTFRPFGELLPRVTDPVLPVLFHRIFAAGKPGVSDLFMGPISKELIYTIAVPVKRDGKIVYSLNATVKVNRLSGLLADQKLPASWRVAVTDSTGRIALNSYENEQFVGKNVVAALQQRIAQEDEDSLEAVTLEGMPVLTAFSRSSTSRWVVAVGIPLEELTAGVRHTLISLVSASFAALALGMWLAWMIGNRIARSITALTQPAIALASGEMPSIPLLQFREANEMRQSLLEAAEALRRTQYDARHDPLTGLSNRAQFHMFVTQQLALCRRGRTELCVLYIDLDGFKAVNDTFGHSVGDQLLRDVSVRISGATRDSDLAARLGGDEFAIALVNCDADQAAVFASRLIEVIAVPYLFSDVAVTVSASVGVAGFPLSGSDVASLMALADQAMYEAKKSGKGCVSMATSSHPKSSRHE